MSKKGRRVLVRGRSMVQHRKDVASPHVRRRPGESLEQQNMT